MAGVTEGNLERILTSESAQPVAVIIDEADAMLGTAAIGDSERRRAFSAHRGVHGQTEYRGRIVCSADGAADCCRST